MKEAKKQIFLKLEQEYVDKLTEHQAQMGGASRTQAIRNLIMNRAIKPKASNHILALCGYSEAIIEGLSLIQNSNFSLAEKLEAQKDLGRYSARIKRILRRYDY